MAITVVLFDLDDTCGSCRGFAQDAGVPRRFSAPQCALASATYPRRLFTDTWVSV